VRRIPPAEAGVIATVEILLAPFWVWLVFAEDPGTAAVIGGAIVLAAILFHLSRGMRFRRAATGKPRGEEAVPPG
jgi:drug/metabolite transporter (DMT)-like permease